MSPLLGRNPEKGCPTRFNRWSEKLHAKLLRHFASLFPVTGETTTDYIFPAALSSVGSWDNMIETQFDPVKNPSTVLTRVFVSGEYIGPGESYVGVGDSIIGYKEDNPGNLYCPVNHPDCLIMLFYG